VALEGEPAVCERLRSMGLCEGEQVEIIKQAPLADPLEYRVGCVHLSLRREAARRVVVDDVRLAGGGGGWRCWRRRWRMRGRTRGGWDR
jgi:Fe2+ transport system protein FeoA